MTCIECRKFNEVYISLEFKLRYSPTDKVDINPNNAEATLVLDKWTQRLLKTILSS